MPIYRSLLKDADEASTSEVKAEEQLWSAGFRRYMTKDADQSDFHHMQTNNSERLSPFCTVAITSVAFNNCQMFRAPIFPIWAWSKVFLGILTRKDMRWSCTQ